LTLEQYLPRIREIAAAARSVRSEIFVLCHGGPIAMPDDARFVLEQLPEIDGFYGASSMERLPTERALTEQVKAFCNLRLAAHQ
jgi:predicted TIM-barrel enzyme